VEVVTDFTYFGTRLTNKNEELVEMQAQIQDANGTYFSILSLIKYHDIN
jgi:adenylate cyclase class IV